MNLISALVAVAAIVILFTIWGGIHLLAQRQLGDRKLGCRGPVYDDTGNPRCCQNPDEPCETAANTPAPPPK